MDKKIKSFRASGQGKACELYAGMKQRREKKDSIVFGFKVESVIKWPKLYVTKDSSR